jgi:predicted MFS family arabinose efflux permease
VVLCALYHQNNRWLYWSHYQTLLVDLNLSLSQIGIYITMLGAFSALFGAGLASLLKKLKRHQALILFSILKLISLADSYG